MITNILRGEFELIPFLLRIPIVLIALSVHECAHGYAAYKMGDPTAKAFGRLTLNPIKHLDLFGTISMLLFGFGWAKPVPVNARRFDNPKKGMAMTALAGPLSNVLLSIIGAILFLSTEAILQKFPHLMGQSEFSFNLWYLLLLFFLMFHIMNLSLAIFNLLPIPPLDGSRLAFVFLPDRLYFDFMKYEQIIQAILMVALFTGLLDTPLSYAINSLSSGIMSAISFLLGLII